MQHIEHGCNEYQLRYFNYKLAWDNLLHDEQRYMTYFECIDGQFGLKSCQVRMDRYHTLNEEIIGSNEN